MENTNNHKYLGIREYDIRGLSCEDSRHLVFLLV